MINNFYKACAVSFLSSLSLAVMATNKPINPDSRPMIFRAGNYGVNVSTWNGAPTVAVSYPQANTVVETDSPIGDSYGKVGPNLTKFAKDWCAAFYSGNAGANVELAGTAGQISLASVSGTFGSSPMHYSGSVTCSWKTKAGVTPPDSGSFPIEPNPSNLLIGNCQTGYQADPLNDYQNDDLSQLRCVPKTSFTGANAGITESCTRPEDLSCSTIHPVHLGTGNKFLKEVDYSGSGAQPLQWIRYYNSQSHPISFQRGPEVSIDSSHKVAPLLAPLGAQWLHSYASYIVTVTDTSNIVHAQVFRPTGRVYQFEKNSSGNWVASQGIILDEKLTSQTDANGNITGWTWTQANDTVESYDANGRLLTITSREGLMTRLTYAATSSVYPSGAPSCVLPSGSPTAPASAPVNGLICITDPQGHQINLQYNSNGQIQNVIDPLGKVIQYTYTPAQLLTTDADFDALGNVSLTHQAQTLSLSQVNYPDNGGKQYLYTESANVPAGTPSSIWLMTGIKENSDTTNSSGWVRFSTYQYEPNFRVSQESLNGNVENYIFTYPSQTQGNPNGPNKLATSVTGPDGNTVLNTFNNVAPTGNTGQIKMAYDSLGGYYTYNSLGNAISYSYPGSPTRSKSMNYDTQNRAAEIWDNLGYNAAQDSTTQHQVLTWHATFHLPTQITEDIPFNKADGTLVSQGKRVTQFTYDTLGRLTQKVIQNVDGSNQTVLDSRTFQYTYDDTNGLGQLSTVKLVNGSTTTILQTLTYYSADSSTHKKGDLNTIKNALNQTTTFNSYDAAGRLLQSTDPNNVVTQYTYDNRGRVLTQSIAGRTTTFTWNGLGQLKSVVKPGNSSLTYSYDAAHRLTQIQDTSGNLLRAAYDSSSRVIAMDKVNISNNIIWRKEWKYDRYNNILQERNVKGAAPTISMNSLTPMVSPVNVAQELVNPLNDMPSPLDTLLPFMGAIQKAEALLKGERA